MTSKNTCQTAFVSFESFKVGGGDGCNGTPVTYSLDNKITMFNTVHCSISLKLMISPVLLIVALFKSLNKIKAENQLFLSTIHHILIYGVCCIILFSQKEVAVLGFACST